MSSDVSQQVYGAGPQLRNMRVLIQQLRDLLRGQLQLADGVTLESDQVLQLQLRLVGDMIDVQFLAPQPRAKITYVLRVTRDVTGMKITDDKLAVQVRGLPDPSFDIVS